MDVQQEWTERITRLVEKGEAIPRYHSSSSQVSQSYESGPYLGWKAQVISALTALLGEQHTYTRQFAEVAKVGWLEEGQAAQSVLRAVKEDLEAGYLLHTVERMVAAEVFTDFLDIAKHLLEQGYKDPAASLIGAVLEDGLRRIASGAGTTGKNLGTLNDACLKAGVYSKLAHQQVTVWITTRNKADHGEFGEYDLKHVEEMHRGVGGFLAQHMT